MTDKLIEKGIKLQEEVLEYRALLGSVLCYLEDRGEEKLLLGELIKKTLRKYGKKHKNTI